MLEYGISVLVLWAFVLSNLYIAFLTIQRLYISPLSKFPGPKIAALTLWYEFYYDVVLGGQYQFKIRELHERYGPIIRINPHELHVSDPDFYDTLYATSSSGEKRDKWQWFTKQFGTPNATMSTPNHDLHRQRRQALNKFFSMQSINRLRPLINEKLEKMCSRFLQIEGTEMVINLEHALAAFTFDVAAHYVLGDLESRLEYPDFGVEDYLSQVDGAKGGLLVKQFPIILYMVSSLPISIQASMSPTLAKLLHFQLFVAGAVRKVMARPESSYTDNSIPTIFHEIMSSKLSPHDKSATRLAEEGAIVIGAGTVTTSWTLTIAFYYLLTTPLLLRRLKNELESQSTALESNSPPQLEAFPFLRAIIQEALRLSYGAATRLQRISPDKPMTYTSPRGHTWLIPAGTPVSMSSVLQHHDEFIFPDSHIFNPDRWLANPGLDRYLVSFSKGSRACIGINLAYMEMFLALSKVFGRFAGLSPDGKECVANGTEDVVLQLIDPQARDVELFADGFMPAQHPESKGVRLRVLSMNQVGREVLRV